METFKTSVKGKELPLEVWLAQGWKEATVLAQQNCFSEELGCQVYKVPIKATSWSEEHTRIHAEVLQHEQEATKKNKAKKRKVAVEGEQNSSDGEMDLPSAGSKDGTSKDPKKEAKDRNSILTKNTALANRAAKALGPLQSSFTAMQKGMEKVEKAEVQLDEGTMESFHKCIASLRAWADASRSCVNAQEATREMEEVQLLPKLPYEASDLKALQQQAMVLQQTLREKLPKREKAKAKAKAAAEAPDSAHVAEPAPKRRRTKTPAK